MSEINNIPTYVSKEKAIVDMIERGTKFVTEHCNPSCYISWDTSEKCFMYSDGCLAHIDKHFLFKCFVEPKKKVKMWLWLLRDDTGRVYPSDVYCDDSENFSSQYLGESETIVQRLDYTEVEIFVE